jgi:hypothetical protein
MKLARHRARALVARLRESNQREGEASDSGEPEVDYRDLERLMTRKLLRA